MKQIKFRAWVGNEFLYCDVLQDDHHAIKKFWVAVSSAGIEPEQFTGLYDSTKWHDLPEADRLSWIELNAGKIGSSEWPGREIYEGDLLSHKYGGGLVECEFGNGEFFTGDVSVLDDSLRIIGHIHENPAAKEKK